jgi:glyoxalase family protein
MENKILGLHHITAIAGNAKRNHDFYTRVLGQRLVKKTVNFDDPQTYHFYYGNETGEPGGILTFFPWEKSRPGHIGTGMATHFSYAVPPGSLTFWSDRFREFNVKHGPVSERFGEKYISFEDPDGLLIELVEPATPDHRKGWETAQISASAATRGFHQATLSLKNIQATGRILTDVFGYHLQKQDSNRYRFATSAVDTAALVDLLEMPDTPVGLNAAGTNHHVAFRVKDEPAQNEFREKIASLGLHITQKIDRDYFYSVYFREPGGVFF